MIEFDIGSSIAKMAEVVLAVEHETRKALERAAKVVEAEAKKEIGHYQDEAQPFVAWAELAQSTKDERVKLGFTENEPGLRTGEMRDSIGHEVSFTGSEAVVASNDDKLVWFELGTSRGQPPRSVLGLAGVHKEDEVVEILGEGAVIGLLGGGVVGGYLKLRGE